MLIHNDVSAHLSLFHLFDFLVEFISFLLVAELFLEAWSGGITMEAGVIVLEIVAVMVVMMMMIVVAAVVGVHFGQLEWLLIIV